MSLLPPRHFEEQLFNNKKTQVLQKSIAIRQRRNVSFVAGFGCALCIQICIKIFDIDGHLFDLSTCCISGLDLVGLFYLGLFES